MSYSIEQCVQLPKIKRCHKTIRRYSFVSAQNFCISVRIFNDTYLDLIEDGRYLMIYTFLAVLCSPSFVIIYYLIDLLYVNGLNASHKTTPMFCITRQ